MIIRPTDPAFPVSTGTNPGNPAAGITVRAHFAAMAMQGIISNPESFAAAKSVAEQHNVKPSEAAARLAVAYADSLIAELNK